MEVEVLPASDVRDEVGNQEMESAKNRQANTSAWWRNPKIKVEQTRETSETPQNADAYEVYTQSKMFRAMRPLFYSLALIGMYHHKQYGSLKQCCDKTQSNTDGETDNNDNQQGRKRKKTPSLTMIYSWCLLILSVLNYLRLFSMFSTGDMNFGPDLFMKCSMMIYFTQAVVCLIVGIRASHSYDSIPKFFIEWQKLNNSVPSLELKFEYVRKVTIIVVSTAWVFVAISIITITYLIFFHPNNIAALFVPMTMDHEHILVMKIALVLLLPVIISQWSFGIVMDSLFSYILYKLFYTWREQFRARISKPAGITTSELSCEQTKHQRISRLVQNVEEFLSLYKALCFVGSFGVLLFVLYCLIYASAVPAYQDPISMASNALWMLLSIISLSSMCIMAVKVNTMVGIYWMLFFISLYQMNSVLGHNPALVRLYWAMDTLGK